MKQSFKIRKAHQMDKPMVKELFAQSIADKKNLLNATYVVPDFLDDFVNTNIDQGNMILVENQNNELELIGEVHYYQSTVPGTNDVYSKEINFFSKPERSANEKETDLIEWLYGEIETKHKDVFSVKVTTSVKTFSHIEHYRKKGILIEGNIDNRLKNSGNLWKSMLPFCWINPSFN
jgi:hypothetical protein